MREQIKTAFQNMLQEDYPEVILMFSNAGTLSQFLDDRITMIDPLIDELLQQEMTEAEMMEIAIQQLSFGFGPSKYHYLLDVMEEEFPVEYDQFNDAGVLKYEVTNLIVCCQAAFDAFEFSDETYDDHFLRHMIIAEMQDYLLSRNQT